MVLLFLNSLPCLFQTAVETLEKTATMSEAKKEDVFLFSMETRQSNGYKLRIKKAVLSSGFVYTEFASWKSYAAR
ncbi:Hypothetical predicted protein [Podarcis lilfordi]|uniref:Uncharacterized protein n=1 Tax=Podarcis lilfordi TaxID=74358 RepID=A0AA35L555_9SAUR|nr:Hypothetical predicted protein [Podarcis lilfordi]